MRDVLIADDNEKIRGILRDFLVNEGYCVDEASDGINALNLANQKNYAIILLDVMMPKMDGFQVCQSIRETSNVPIIMITARGEDYDRIMGLDMGADDYIVKPFVLQEVLARIRAILRRIGKPQTQNRLNIDSLSINLDDYEVLVHNTPLSLTKKEVEILWTLASHPHQVFTRDHLLDSVWGTDYYGDARTVDAHIKRLRAKLQVHEDVNWHITTVWGVGYKFEVDS